MSNCFIIKLRPIIVYRSLDHSNMKTLGLRHKEQKNSFNRGLYNNCEHFTQSLIQSNAMRREQNNLTQTKHLKNNTSNKVNISIPSMNENVFFSHGFQINVLTYSVKQVSFHSVHALFNFSSPYSIKLGCCFPMLTLCRFWLRFHAHYLLYVC